MDDWNPTTEQDQKLKEALLKLSSSTEGVTLTSVDNEQEKRFILQGKAYFGGFAPFCASLICPIPLVLRCQGICDDGQGFPDHL